MITQFGLTPAEGLIFHTADWMPLVMLHSVTFLDHRLPYGLKLEGRNTAKNLLTISATLVVDQGDG